MRILLVANTLPPTDVSGVGEQVMQLSTGLRAAGHEVEILGRGEGGARGPKLLFPLTVLFPFLRHRREFKPDVIQVHESDGVAVALAVWILGALWKPRPRLVALLQVSYVEEIRAVRELWSDGVRLSKPSPAERRFKWLKAPLQVLFGWTTAWCADQVLTPSDRTGEEVRRDYLVAETSTVPNVKEALRREPEEVRQRAGFLFVGRLRVRKGVEFLLDAVARLKAGGLRPAVTVVGDGEHREALELLAAELNVADCVSFVGRKGAFEIQELMRQSLALVVPSLYEGMPLVILEAMEESLPIIASQVSGIPEVVSDRVAGWLVPPEDSGALVEAMREAVESPQEALRRGEAGRDRLDEYYRPQNAVAAWLASVQLDGCGDESMSTRSSSEGELKK